MLSNDFACNILQNVTYYKCIKNISSEKGYIASHTFAGGRRFYPENIV